jgi:hypothetical protein
MQDPVICWIRQDGAAMNVKPWGHDAFNDKGKKSGFSLIGFYADVTEEDKNEPA